MNSPQLPANDEAPRLAHPINKPNRNMKYMVVWNIKEQNMAPIVERWKTLNPVPGKGATQLARYHELGTGKGYSLYEASNPGALAKHLAGWADLADQKIVPVLDDNEMKRAMK
jgi:Protein of unknown function (DUF3303)